MPKSKKHINIPIFIPHLGCPNMCVFCNQRSISGCAEFDISAVEREIETVLSTADENTQKEIAFFGGSFTAIDRDLMLSLLNLANKYYENGLINSIRISTRPDYISKEILKILKKYNVKTIELGIQSINDNVLLASKRGHTAEHSRTACALITKGGFNLVGQMMIGLPKSSARDEIECAKFICRAGASAARVYPTVIFADTELFNMAKVGEYIPLTLNEAVERTKNVLDVFDRFNLPCIRVGLCASEALSSADALNEGTNHSAIGELAMGELFYERVCALLDAVKDNKKGENLTIFVPLGATSKVIGQRKVNKIRICEKFDIKRLKIIENESLSGYNIRILLS